MSLKYALLENLLTARADDYTAQPQGVTSHDLNSITEKMLRKGSTITKTDTIAVLNSFFEVVQEITRSGEAINTEIINTNFSIQGVFDGITDTFDPERHTLKINVNAGKLLKKELPLVVLEKTTANEILPHILEVKDNITDSINENITSGGVLTITGSMLKIQGEGVSNGVLLVAEDGTTHKVTTIVDNKPARLIVILPTLLAGEYTLQVTTQYTGGGTSVKKSRTGIFNKTLTVV